MPGLRGWHVARWCATPSPGGETGARLRMDDTNTNKSLDAVEAAARRGLHRALGTLGLFTTWLLVSWIGPIVHPVGDLDLPWAAALLAAYSLFTAVTFAGLGWTALGLLVAGRTRGQWAPLHSPGRRTTTWVVVLAFAFAGTSLVAAFLGPFSPVEGALGVAVAAALVIFAEALHLGLRLQRVRAERASVPPPPRVSRQVPPAGRV